MKQIPKLISVLAVFGLIAFGLGGSGFGQEPAYVGIAKCKMCHKKQHEVWTGSRHAQAFNDLKPAEKKDGKCLTCHQTGYRATRKVSQDLQSVQCEACHGPGSGYLMVHPRKDKEAARKAGLLAKPTPDVCKGCHNEQSPTFKGFDYGRMWAKIKHPN